MEIWKEIKIPDIYPYEVSNFGRVRSLDKEVIRKDGRRVIMYGKPLKIRLDGKGYSFVSLYKGHKVALQLRVHRLVAEAFIPKVEGKTYINHIDGCRTNNYTDNLEWCTPSENTKDGIKRGTINNPGKKIDLNIVTKIRGYYVTGNFTQYELANKFNLSQTQICRIVNYQNWGIKRIKSLKDIV